MGAAGARCFGGFYFFEEAGAAEAAGGLQIRRHREMRELGAPAVTFGMAIEGRATLGALLLHTGSMTRVNGTGKVAGEVWEAWERLTCAGVVH